MLLGRERKFSPSTLIAAGYVQVWHSRCPASLIVDYMRNLIKSRRSWLYEETHHFCLR